MPDFLTHVLVMYVVLQVSGWWLEWVDESHIYVGMVGALVPDLVKITLVVPHHLVESIFGVPFRWAPLHRAGGAIISACLLTLLLEKGERRTGFLFLTMGFCSHLVLDAMLIRPGPNTYDILYPVSSWPFPILDFDLYLSSDYWPSAVASATAVTVYISDRFIGTELD